MLLKLAHINKLSIISEKAIVQEIEEMTQSRRFFHVVILDIRLFIRSRFNKSLSDIINEADLVLPAGQFFNRWLKSLIPCKDKIQNIPWDDPIDNLDEHSFVTAGGLEDKAKHSQEINIPDCSNLGLLLIRYFEKRNTGFFLIGDSLRNINVAAMNIKKGFPELMLLGKHPKSYLKKQPKELLEKLRKVSPHILIVDIDTVKQEQWIYEHKDVFSSSVCIGLNNEILMYAGKANTFKSKLKKILNGDWLFVFYYIYYIILFFLYKTVLKKEVQCLE